MRRAWLAAGLLAALAAGAAAQPQTPGTAQGGVINLSLVDALVAVDAQDLAGVFSFIPEEQTPMAMADYLMHDHKALKKFVRKGERDLKLSQGINEWDKKVLLFLVGMNSQPLLPLGIARVSPAWRARVNALSLAQALPLNIIVQQRAAGRK
ncbi:MAG: hypothetical protein A2X36_08870 [Elusimicrobia bacterium GWA2_69_24]|nr:MAG: hypothetical protein A2X36_08870 [Elusimicrobia bacterium GWA2_69_24]HBL18065.1 hypothetical protein [Elusimicrobiota bacterium]